MADVPETRLFEECVGTRVEGKSSPGGFPLDETQMMPRSLARVHMPDIGFPFVWGFVFYETDVLGLVGFGHFASISVIQLLMITKIDPAVEFIETFAVNVPDNSSFMFSRNFTEVLCLHVNSSITLRLW